MKKLIFSVSIFFAANLFLNAQELVIAEERLEPGIIFVFEGAIKDHITPVSMHLEEDKANVHIEARVNWDVNNTPKGTPKGGFVPYLHITSKVTNEKTGLSTFIAVSYTHLTLPTNREV